MEVHGAWRAARKQLTCRREACFPATAEGSRYVGQTTERSLAEPPSVQFLPMRFCLHALDLVYGHGWRSHIPFAVMVQDWLHVRAGCYHFHAGRDSCTPLVQQTGPEFVRSVYVILDLMLFSH